MAQAKTEYERTRTGTSVEALKRAVEENLFYVQGRALANASDVDLYLALAYTVRDRLLDRWVRTIDSTFHEADKRIVCYMSAEFLLGPHLENNLLNLGIRDNMRKAITELGYDYQHLVDIEEEPGLGNGGLGRLAACFMDSMATLDVPAIGYGIRYEYGIFDQEIRDGWQVEVTDPWLRWGNPWEIARPTRAVEVLVGGHTEMWNGPDGQLRVRWVPAHVVKGIPYDTLVMGWRSDTANMLRLWKSEAVESFDFEAFNVGEYSRAVEKKVESETLTKVLYPNDSISHGKALRLLQQHFFVSCSLQDALRVLRLKGLPVTQFHKRYAFQLNDTHPSIAVAELMRLLIDVHHVDWDTAWDVTRRTFSYTNHTLLPEALERWPVDLFQRLLPRHLEIIYEINSRHLDEVRARFPGDEDRVQRMSLIDERGPRYVAMAHLAAVGSHTINGVAELHSQLLRSDVLRDFAEMTPEKFTNVTNGVTPRRWMLESNTPLADLITSRIGDGWLRDLQALKQLEPLADDAEFREAWRSVKLTAKRTLAAMVERTQGLFLNPESMFDVLVKRLHEYKRQHLKVLHILTLYNRLKTNPGLDIVPCTFVFGGKAAPGYFMAKLIIRLIHGAADVVNNDPEVGGRLKVVFLPNYNVQLGQRVYPAADLSEQISTAGKEASGTGNMKFSMNGALTIGTMDGANIEIREEVGADQFFLFGHTAEEVAQIKASGYSPLGVVEHDHELRQALELIESGRLSAGDRSLYRPLLDSLYNRDEYLVFADYRSYLDVQDRVCQTWRTQEEWVRMSILNVARSGKFSSDRSIAEYASRIWNVAPGGMTL